MKTIKIVVFAHQNIAAAGRVPFEGDTPFTVGVKQKSEPPKNPKLFNPNIPDALSGVILKCLEKDKEKRYLSATDVRADLEKVEEGLPTTLRIAAERTTSTRKPFTSKEVTVKFQPKRLIIPALAIVAAIVAAVIFWPKKTSNLDPKLVAVAVFENKTGDPKLDHIGSLAAERIMQGLMQVGELTVAPMPSAETLAAESKRKDKLRALADVTKAGKIVHGDYYLQGDTIQFHAWVEDMAARKNFLALEPASGPVRDPAAVACGNLGQFAKAEEIARKLAESRADLSTMEQLFLDHVQTILHGDLDSQLRTARQVNSYKKVWEWAYENARVAEDNNYPREAVELLKGLDPYDEAHKDWSQNYWSVLRWAYHMLGDHKQELKAARRARQQFPESLSMLFAEVDAQAARGQTQELQKLFEESISLPPQGSYSPGNITLDAGQELRAHGFKEDSIRVLNQALQWFEGRPGQEKASVRSRYRQAVTLYLLGRWAEAKALLEGLHAEVSDDTDYLGYLGTTAARMGYRKRALPTRTAIPRKTSNPSPTIRPSFSS